MNQAGLILCLLVNILVELFLIDLMSF
jgi:hypothetical protein